MHQQPSIMEFAIVGHSDETESKFPLPTGVKLVFYADPGELCYAYDDILKHGSEIIERMQTQIFDSINDKSDNYNISFKDEKGDGIFQVTYRETLSKTIPILTPFDSDLIGNTFYLNELCNSIKTYVNEIVIKRRLKTFPNIKIYCIFCRGEKEAFTGTAGRVAEGREWTSSQPEDAIATDVDMDIAEFFGTTEDEEMTLGGKYRKNKKQKSKKKNKKSKRKNKKSKRSRRANKK
jgi:hypothetical protein